MLINLTDMSSESLQQQIVRQIRSLILAGGLSSGAALPSIRKFARDHRVSVITVQRAYESLMHDGLIHARRGKGFFVSDIPEQRKGEMAKQRLSDNLRPIVSAALDDGLAHADIKTVLSAILSESSPGNTGE